MTSNKKDKFFKKLNTPSKIQDYLNTLRFNHEKDGEKLMAPLEAAAKGRAQCLEGAALGAYLLSKLGYPPLIMHLEASREDLDHCIAPFRERGLWGALSKTNHAVLRYREPVYRSLRELVMSYFHEYFLNDGTKTLRRFSRPLDLSNFPGYEKSEHLWDVDRKLDKIKHYDLVPKNILRKLRKADPVERKAGKIAEWKK